MFARRWSHPLMARRSWFFIDWHQMLFAILRRLESMFAGRDRLGFACSLFALVLTLVAMSALGYAENITGKVLDPQGSAVADAQIRLFDRIWASATALPCGSRTLPVMFSIRRAVPSRM